MAMRFGGWMIDKKNLCVYVCSMGMYRMLCVKKNEEYATLEWELKTKNTTRYVDGFYESQ